MTSRESYLPGSTQKDKSTNWFCASCVDGVWLFCVCFRESSLVTLRLNRN